MPTTYPDFVGATQPADSPALPVWADVYAPPVSGGAAGGSPTIAAYLNQAGPDNHVTATGSLFQTFTAFGQTGAGDATTAVCTNMILESGRAAFVLPSNLPASSMYFVWPSNGSGYGLPVLVNQTSAIWLQCLSTGTNYGLNDGTEFVYLNGQNLKHTSGNCAVYIISTSGGTGQYITTSYVDPYSVRFTLPALAAGAYYVWAHNGHGGAYGWSLCPDILNTDTAHNLLINWTNFTASVGPPSGTDDTTAIKNAISSVAGHGSTSSAAGTVLFGAGTYYTNQNLGVAGGNNSGIRLLGDPAGTTLTTTAGFSGNSILNLTGCIDGVNIVWNDASTIIAGSNAQGIIGGQWPFSLRNMTLDTHLMARQLGVVGVSGGDTGVSPFNGGANTALIGGKPTGHVYQNVKFYCGVGYFGRAMRGIWESCNFHGGWATNSGGPISPWLSIKLTVNNCTFDLIDPVNFPNEGRCFFGSQGTMDSIYIGNCTATGMQDTSGDLNKGELIACESNTTWFNGPVISSTSNTVTISTSSVNFVNNQVCVMSSSNGGEGQWAFVLTQASGVLGLDRNWLVPPDSTCTVTVFGTISRCFIYNNNLACSDAVQTNSCATQFFGGAINCVSDGNTFTGTSHGNSMQPIVTSGKAVPVIFNLHQNNTFTGTKVWGARLIGGSSIPGLTAPNGETIICFGNVYRNQNITMTATGNPQSLIAYIGEGPRYDCNIFERVTAANAALGLHIANGSNNPTSGIVLYENSLSRGTATLSGSASIELPRGNYRIVQIPGESVVTTPGDVVTVHAGDTHTTHAGDIVYRGGSQFKGFAV